MDEWGGTGARKRVRSRKVSRTSWREEHPGLHLLRWSRKSREDAPGGRRLSGSSVWQWKEASRIGSGPYGKSRGTQVHRGLECQPG